MNRFTCLRRVRCRVCPIQNTKNYFSLKSIRCRGFSSSVTNPHDEDKKPDRSIDKRIFSELVRHLWPAGNPNSGKNSHFILQYEVI